MGDMTWFHSSGWALERSARHSAKTTLRNVLTKVTHGKLIPRFRAPAISWARTQQMVSVSQELLAVRTEARRVSAQQLEQGTYLRSQAEAAAAQEFEAQTLLLQSQLEYAQAQDELTQATGRTAN